MPSVQVFAFNHSIAEEFKSRITDAALTEPFKHTPSPHQQAIFDWIAKGKGSLLVKAVAGSGKTTSMIMGLRYIPGLKEARAVSARTFHSVGFSAVCKRLGLKTNEVKADGSKLKNLAKTTFSPADYEDYSDFAIRLVSLAKGEGIGPLTSDTAGAWLNLINHHDLFIDADGATEERGVDLARALLRRSNETTTSGSIDYDDMLYLPLLWKLKLWQNDWVIVDECQDTNPVRRAIIKLALRPGGRLIAVGDEKQAIYGFTGASHDAMDLIRHDFNCSELPLTVSYRCPHAVAVKVSPLVPHFSVPEAAIRGEVVSLPLAEAVKRLGPADAVLCRQTAPLVGLAFRLIAHGIGCHVLGKEIGAGLAALVKNQRAKGIEHLLAKLQVYCDREIAKHMARGEEGKAEGVSDRVACVRTVIDHLPETCRTIPALLAKIEGLFSDANGVLSLATVHKVKGREFRRVAILRPDLMPSKWARQEHQAQQERNLMYVCWTRAQETLIELTDDEIVEAKPTRRAVEGVS